MEPVGFQMTEDPDDVDPEDLEKAHEASRAQLDGSPAISTSVTAIFTRRRPTSPTAFARWRGYSPKKDNNDSSGLVRKQAEAYNSARGEYTRVLRELNVAAGDGEEFPCRSLRRRIEVHPGFPLSKSMAAGYLRTMSTRILPLLLSLVFFLCGIPAQAATAYRPPDLEKEIFDTKKIKLEKFDRTDAVGGLVAVARDFDDEDKVDFELRAHALAIAHRLDKDNDRVKSVLEQLKDKGKTIDEPATKARIVGRLMRGLRGLGKAKDNEDNNKCAAYIVDIALRLDPDGESVKKLEDQQKTLSEAGFKADWKDMLGKAVRHSRNPWEEEEEVFEKKEVTMPGGTAEKFAQAQSRINGLVVQQLPGGNLAGSASTVNATALKEPGQKDLLFTFNQDVGPMMGGCLEEVIKFLRVRYADKEDKIPTGFKIELGFQDKYVPKDGPSAATLFTLLLDSLAIRTRT